MFTQEKQIIKQLLKVNVFKIHVHAKKKSLICD